VTKHKENKDAMLKKISYVVYKLRKAWGLLDFISMMTWPILNLTIICYAVYFQLAIIWAWFLLLFIIQVFTMSYKFNNAANKQRNEFAKEGKEKWE
jgi:hypothetical protein